MIKEYAKVKIRQTNITGIVVDIHTTKGEQIFVVESDEKGVPGGYGSEDSWKLFDCTEDELEVL